MFVSTSSESPYPSFEKVTVVVSKADKVELERQKRRKRAKEQMEADRAVEDELCVVCPSFCSCDFNRLTLRAEQAFVGDR